MNTKLLTSIVQCSNKLIPSESFLKNIVSLFFLLLKLIISIFFLNEIFLNYMV